ncbi:MAG TPA: metallophosphoesterase family protein [Anaeromyxobacter sp.]|jgi:diadenosine tetraphosphatase ApaH/serine/threonine PP2A family protein phosphatase|nr:metallophosphoesterase family protein [Anaeromyxobacter sp.]
MKLALLADLHANLEAVEACLEHARREAAEAFAFLGDLVGYGADPVAVLDVVAAHAAQGAIVVRGNHDAAVLELGAETMHRSAEAAIAWTRARLEDRHRAFLASLPLLVRRGAAVFVHASADRPEDWTYVTDPLRAEQSLDAAAAPFVFCGHVHEPVLYFTGAASRPVPFHPVPGVPIPVPARRRCLAVVGSAGQPRDGKTAACWALWDDARERLTFHRVPYDVAAAAAKVRAAGLPERLAHRLERGE